MKSLEISSETFYKPMDAHSKKNAIGEIEVRMIFL